MATLLRCSRLAAGVDNAGRVFPDLNLRGELALSNPIKLIWLAVTYGTGGAKPYFFEDMLELFRQFSGKTDRQRSTREQVLRWMDRWPSGLDPRIVRLREENRDRIIGVIIQGMDAGEIRHPGFELDPGLSAEQKFLESWIGGKTSGSISRSPRGRRKPSTGCSATRSIRTRCGSSETHKSEASPSS